MAFLDIKISIEGNGLCTSVYNKPTDSHSSFLYSSTHPSHVKNSIPFRSFSDFVIYVVTTLIFQTNQKQCASFLINVAILFLSFKRTITRAQQIDRQSTLQTAHKENTDRIPFTLTFHPHNHAVKSIILKNFTLPQNDSETGTIFSPLSVISFKCDKNIGNFLVRSSSQTNDQPDRDKLKF